MVYTKTKECLKLTNVTAIRNGKTILKNITFTINHGEIVSIIGPNGAGKSTLLDVIFGYVKPAEGQIIFNGKNITNISPHKICHLGIARTFQISIPFTSMTALENVIAAIVFGKGVKMGDWLKQKNQKLMDKAKNYLNMAGILHKANIRADELTLSEQRRLEVARALATNPTLLLLDEFAAGLSPQAIDNALNLIDDLRNHGLTVLIIDHFLNVTVKVSNKLIAMDKGRIIASGSTEDVLKHPTVVASYLGV